MNIIVCQEANLAVFIAEKDKNADRESVVCECVCVLACSHIVDESWGGMLQPGSAVCFRILACHTDIVQHPRRVSGRGTERSKGRSDVLRPVETRRLLVFSRFSWSNATEYSQSESYEPGDPCCKMNARSFVCSTPGGEIQQPRQLIQSPTV